jgi:hypothetical protein
MGVNAQLHLECLRKPLQDRKRRCGELTSFEFLDVDERDGRLTRKHGLGHASFQAEFPYSLP